MRIRGIGRLRRLAQPYTNRFFPGPIILAYHRVADLSSDPQLLSVTPRHFAEHLEVLRKEGYPTRLQDLASPLRDRRALPHGVVVTFDDGYGDNLINAKPVLERYDIPATVFVTTGYIGQPQYFWWDQLDTLLLHRRSLPKILRLHIEGRTHEWDLTPQTNNSGAAGACRRPWNVLEQSDPSPRHLVYRSLHKLLRPLIERDQRKVLDELAAWAGAGKDFELEHAALSRVQIAELAEGGLVEVGSHSVTHPVFAALPVPAQRAEIEQSKNDLEEILGRPVKSFAYPFGGKSDYTEETAALVAEAGYVCACANFPAIVESTVDRFQLPRFLVRDWDGDEFSRRVGGWLGG